MSIDIIAGILLASKQNQTSLSRWSSWINDQQFHRGDNLNDERCASSSWLHRTNTRDEVGPALFFSTEWIEEIWHLSKHDFRIPNEFDSNSTVMNGSFFRFVGLGGNNMTLSKRERERRTYGGSHQRLLIMRRGS